MFVLRIFSVVSLLVALAISCGPAVDASGECRDLAEGNQGCWNDELDTRCQELHQECPGKIVVAESCPVQLGCP